MRMLLILGVFAIVATACGEMGMDADSGNSLNSGGTGVGGSTARFAINGDHLYIVNHTSLNVFDISDERDPNFQTTTDIGRGIETIFGYKDNLFIGSQSGMFIYSILEDGTPQFLSNYIHQTACDPVIANDQFAYVTIRSGEACGTALFEANQLITIDISDLTRPFEVNQQQMENPRGLCFFKGDLYVAEGNKGLKKFNLTDPAHPQLEAFYQDIAANDMIPLGNTMIITRDEGIFQFGCENDEIYLLSPIR